MHIGDIMTRNVHLVRPEETLQYAASLMAEWDIARYVRSGRLRLVLEDQTPTRADVYAVYPQQLHLSTRVRSLIDFLVERFKDIDHLEGEL